MVQRMSHLSPAQSAELRDDLERQLIRLRKSMSVTDEALKTVELDQGAVGRLSRMDSLQSQGVAKSLREREEVSLALIQDALRRIEAGTYGLCTGCGSAVPYPRLVVFPESATCGRCDA